MLTRGSNSESESDCCGRHCPQWSLRSQKQAIATLSALLAAEVPLVTAHGQHKRMTCFRYRGTEGISPSTRLHCANSTLRKGGQNGSLEPCIFVTESTSANLGSGRTHQLPTGDPTSCPAVSMARSLLAAGTLLLALALCARAQDTVTVNNDRQAARALGEQSVTTIQLAYGA